MTNDEDRTAMKTLRVGLIGLGYIGKIHVAAYRAIPLCFAAPSVVPEIAAVLRSRLDTERALMQGDGLGLVTQDVETFYGQSLDLVDICTPNFMHRAQAEEALGRGLPVYCEKPLAKDLAEARAMNEWARRAGVSTQVAFVLRYLPAVRQMKGMLEAGEIGEVLNCRAQMFHSGYLDPERPMTWRLRQRESGGGALADLGSHLIDLVRYLLGSVARVRALTRTYIVERPAARAASRCERVDVDDWAHCVLELQTGPVCVLEVTRMAAGAGEATRLEVYGRQGSLVVRMDDPEAVHHFDLRSRRWSRGEIDVKRLPGDRPVVESWPASKYSHGSMLNAHIAAAYSFLRCVSEGRPSVADFAAGLATQEVLAAAYRSAAEGGVPVDLPLEWG